MSAESVVLLVHICSATVGLMSGYTAMVLRKGSNWHQAAGTVYFVSMLSMSSTAAWVGAFMRPVALHVVTSLLTFYLVATGWRTARNRDGQTNAFDLGALLFILAVGTFGVASGFGAASAPGGTKDGYPAAMYFVFSSIALLFGVWDIRMLLRGGIAGAKRVARHLWRMCFALLLTTMSLYPGNARLFPQWVRETKLLWLPHILLIGAIIFWMVRILARRRAQRDDVGMADASRVVGLTSMQPAKTR